MRSSAQLQPIASRLPIPRETATKNCSVPCSSSSMAEMEIDDMETFLNTEAMWNTQEATVEVANRADLGQRGDALGGYARVMKVYRDSRGAPTHVDVVYVGGLAAKRRENDIPFFMFEPA